MLFFGRLSRLAVTLCLFVLCLSVAACASRQTPPDGGSPPAAGDDAGNADAPLQTMQVRKGQSVFVKVSGGEAGVNADLESMLTGYLQSEKDLTPADSAAKADLIIRIKMEEIYPMGSRSTSVNAGHALGSTATGAMLGALLGGATGGRSGLAWGASAGAALGLGTALLDSSGKNKIWGMKALVGMGRDGKEPDEAQMNRITVRAEGANMAKDDIMPALEDTLSRKILDSLRS